MSENTKNITNTTTTTQNGDFSEIEQLFREPAPRYRSLFTPYPSDPIQAGIRRIGDLLSLKETAANVICEASREQVDEWTSWLQSAVTNTAGRQLQDLFPPAAIEHFRDTHGKRLPGLRLVTRLSDDRTFQFYMERERAAVRMAAIEPAVFWLYIDPDDTDLTLEDQENYLRIKVLPAVAFGLMSAFSNEALVLQDENDQTKAALAELKRRVHALESENSGLKQRCEDLQEAYDETKHSREESERQLQQEISDLKSQKEALEQRLHGYIMRID